jgi:hypothetical protein
MPKKTVVAAKKPTKELATPAEISDALGPTASPKAVLAAVRAGVPSVAIGLIKKAPGRPKAPDADAKKAAAEAAAKASAERQRAAGREHDRGGEVDGGG